MAISRVYFRGRISRPERIIRVTRFMRQNKYGYQDDFNSMTSKSLCLETHYTCIKYYTSQKKTKKKKKRNICDRILLITLNSARARERISFS